jgi:superfamily II DNA/RNA helicase
MPPVIKKLADKFLTNPKYIEVARPASSNLNIAQHKVAVTSRNKKDVLRALLRADNVTTAIVFCNRKTTVRELAKSLQQSGFSAGEIHGDMDQSSRIAELDRFKAGTINILCASDVAARGLDVKGVSHVFNFDTPWHPDDYVHRIGRTGRAGATGRAFTFVTPEDAEAIDNVEKLTGGKIPVYELGGGSAPVAAAAEGAATASEARPRRDRNVKTASEAQPAKEPRAPREARATREQRAPREARAPREERAPRAERKPQAAKPVDNAHEGEGWNGPMPGFLGVSAL